MPRKGKSDGLISRRRFLAWMAGGAAAFAGIEGLRRLVIRDFSPKGFKPSDLSGHLAVAGKADPYQAAVNALNSLGGLGRLVSKGDVVVVKPNIAWDTPPELGANTHPEVVRAVVTQAVKAGAARVRVFDRTVSSDPRACYERSGIASAASSAGASVELVRPNLFETVNIPGAFSLDEWEFYRPALEADVLINVPVAKHHTASRLSLGLKNMMGILGGERGRIHQDIHHKLVDIGRAAAVDLTVMDCTRIMVRHGPTGGRPSDLEHPNIVAASVDRVACDAFAATLFGLSPADVGYIAVADGVLKKPGGVCTMDFDSLGVERV